MSGKIRIEKDGMSDLDDTDSEAEYSEGVKKMLASTRKKGKAEAESEEELYAFSGSDSNDEQQNADSDIEGAEDDDLPDKKAWGRHKGAFYSTDYIDQDYGGFTEREEKIAEQEEIEARAIQERLAKELDDQDFTLDIFHKKPETTDEVEQTFVKADLSSLSQRQKQQLFLKESPEFTGLIEDFKGRMDVLHKYLMPIKKLHDEGSIKSCLATEFVSCHYNMILNYCNNILFYLLLKSKRLSIQNHPVVKRLYQYRQLIVQLDPIFDDVIQPQITEILANLNTDSVNEAVDKSLKTSKVKKPKKLKLLKTVNMTNKSQKRVLEQEDGDDNNEFEETVPNLNKRSKLDLQDLQSSSEAESENEEKNEVSTVNETDGKRAITYQIAKNKGLMPKRKKEQRNPRVKHRNKFRKAKIRRKGAIREVRTETSRYGGEMSGIKASVKKSIKIK